MFEDVGILNNLHVDYLLNALGCILLAEWSQLLSVSGGK
jgi:hypothetical protein